MRINGNCNNSYTQIAPASAVFCFSSDPNILKPFLNFITGSAQTIRERETEREKRKREGESRIKT